MITYIPTQLLITIKCQYLNYIAEVFIYVTLGILSMVIASMETWFIKLLTKVGDYTINNAATCTDKAVTMATQA